MKETPYTPGPWTIDECPASDSEDGNATTDITAYADENGKEGATLATVNRWSYGDDPPTPESESNARLIAAAPDLLEAAISALAWLQHCGMDDTAQAIRLKDAIRIAVHGQDP